MKLTRLCLHAPVATLLPARLHRYLHSKNKTIEARVVYGFSSAVPKTNVPGYLSDFLDSLLRDVKKSPTPSLLRVTVGAWLHTPLNLLDISWNHAKIVAVDGNSLIQGGHNMWTLDYREF